MRKKTVARISIIVAAILLLCTFLSNTVYSLSLTNVTTILTREGVITHKDEAEARFIWDGVQVKAAADWTITEFFVKEGDSVQEGTPLFRVEMENAEIKHAELSLALLRAQNLLDELAESPADRQDVAHARAVADAAKALSQARDSVFNGYAYQNAVADAELDLSRCTAELTKAEKALDDALNEPRYDFDAYSYQIALEDAQIARDRSNAALTVAEAELIAAKRASYGFFDDFSYQTAISAARIAQTRAQAAYDDARAAYDDALVAFGEGSPEVRKALQDMNEAKYALDDAKDALNIAQENLSRAREAFEREASSERDRAVDMAQEKVDAAQTLAFDAALAVKRAQEGWTKAVVAFEKDNNDTEKKRLDTLTDTLESARADASDAIRALARAKEEENRAKDSFAGEREIRVQSAEENLSRATEDLTRAHEAGTGKNQFLRQLAEAEAEFSIARMQFDAFSLAMPADGLVCSANTGTVSGVVACVGDAVSKGSVILSVISTGGALPLVFSLPVKEGSEYQIGTKGNCDAVLLTVSENGHKDLTNATSFFTIESRSFLPESGEIEFTASHAIVQSPAYGAAAKVYLTRKGNVQPTLVPAECVYVEGGQHFVLATRTRDGLFGTETYIQKILIRVEDTNGIITSIKADGFFDKPVEIIRDTTNPVNVGEVVFVSENNGNNW